MADVNDVARDRDGRMIALGLVGIVMMLILPLPAIVLDVLLTFSITCGLLVFLLAVNFGDPVEFSSFPSVLLVTTMLRLSLNIASTRLILLHGHEGVDAAGSVIKSFGAFVVGGSYVVGIIVFVILVVINFKVITAGAGRISEVAARFTLDAMPGKQMAIDNDLANGHIDEATARKRRKAIADEADFYGAMDGANKFVKGDAVAGLIITAINVVGGIIIGVAQQHLSVGDAAKTYTILTVGDGLVSQIPALLTSTAAGLIASRTASGEDLGTTMVKQLVGRPEPLTVAGVALAIIAMAPGMPTFAFMGLSGGCFMLARRAKRALEKPQVKPEVAKKQGDEEVPLHDLLKVDLLVLEVGFDLVPLVDRNRGGDLLKRIAAVRRQLVPELGLVVPPVHVRDNLRLPSGTYRLLLSGQPIGEGALRPGRVLAINPGGASGELKGERTTEPAFGMPAVWIGAGDRERAELLGYTVVDPATVAATHITELLRNHAAELLGRAEAQELLDAMSRTQSKLVEELIPTLLPLGEVIKVLRNLLREGVGIRDLRTILEALADHAASVKDTDALTELVRERLSRQISARYADERGCVNAFVLAPETEAALRGRGPGGATDGTVVPRLVKGLEQAIAASRGGTEPLLVVAPELRRSVAGLAARHAPGLAVLSLRELDGKTKVTTTGVVKLAA
ncbi:MAG: flagellar biosynthesis protein FlhA [Deltaproteobacteria bacterium]|nr:flagellar biosynthesis protein FlhA [Deltaproteobacteria bacterium]MBK8237933.1 flagellar biosynthesis protein FlhA [Deltaproteobacteria bacterium]